MDSFKLKDERSLLINNMETLIEVAKQEDRDLTDDEQNTWNGFNTEIENLDKKITIAERQEELNKSIAANLSAAKPTKEVKELRDYSFQEAMQQSVSGKLEGLVKEMDREARNNHPNQLFRGVAIPSSVLEHRAINNTDINATEVMAFTDQLEANLVLASAGANFYSGVADQKFPIISGISSSWVSDYSGSDVTASGSTTNLTLTPKKLISTVDISAESMTQNAGIEAALRRNMAASVASSLEAALLGVSDVTDAPTSIFADAGTFTGSTGAPAASVYVDAEAEVLGNDVPLQGGRFAYLMDKTTYSAVKALAQISNVSALYDNVDKMLNGYFSLFSTNVGNGGTGGKAHCLFGDFSRVHIAQFGGIDMLFDPYTKSRQGVGSLVVTSLVDGDATNNDVAFMQMIEA